MHPADLGFPLWLRINHYVNFLFLTLLIRSGIQILADHPRLYWNVHCKPNSEWLHLTKASVPTDKLWTSHDEETYAPAIALPGGKHTLGTARHFHFFAVMFWLLNWCIYVALLFITGNWPRLIPTSWEVVPGAVHTFFTYTSFHLPPASEYHPYDPLQQLAYGAVVFVLTPLAMLTGMAMSPAVVAHWPWYQRLFGNRQIARSIHFIVMLSYIAFFFVHVTLVVLTGFTKNMNHIVLGGAGPSWEAVYIGLMLIALVVVINLFLNWWSNKSPLTVQTSLGWLTDKAMSVLFDKMTSRQEYREDQISPYLWVNGRPPETEEYRTIAANQFADFQLAVYGLVENQLSLSLCELHSLPKKNQITLHNCIQGWSGIAKWGGVPVSEIIACCKPLPKARYVIFHSYDIDAQGLEYYGSLSMEEAMHPQAILAYEMNGRTLPLEYGAPLRLRVETKLGFKMVKYLRALEFVEDYRAIGKGQGGYREDNQYFGTIASM